MIQLKRTEAQEQNVDRNKIFYKRYSNTYVCTRFKFIGALGDDIKNNIITMAMANNEHNQKKSEFRNNTKPKNPNQI